jgi:hypothetical protein
MVQTLVQDCYRIIFVVLERSYIRPLSLFTSPNFLPSLLKHPAAAELTMSSTRETLAHRHVSSISAVKNDNVNLEESVETVEVLANQEYHTRYPNKWAKIRSATICQSSGSGCLWITGS